MLVKKVLLMFLLCVSGAFAQEVIVDKTVSQCASDLATSSFGEKKAKDICQKYSQEAINCATELAKAKRLSYTFESALKDCARSRP